MTEAEWLACDDPVPMLEFLRGRASDRKLRLFSCACCRQVWKSIPLGGCQGAVLAAERYCEGIADYEELGGAHAAAQFNLNHLMLRSPLGQGQDAFREPAVAATCAASTGTEDGLSGALETAMALARSDRGVANRHRSGILRDIFNPFHPTTLAPACLTPDVLSLAHAAYDERELPSGHIDPVRLNVLADALEDAGCADNAILSHLRSPGPHVRGCWALDLILGK
jgi:hypothetical protein